MNEPRYTVEFNGDFCATNMDIHTALLLVEAMTEKYYEEIWQGAKITIYEMSHGRKGED